MSGSGPDRLPPDDVWLPVLARRLGGSVSVTGRGLLGGGYVAAAVQRVDLEVAGRTMSVVVKQAAAAEIAAMRAVAVVVDLRRPRLLAAGRDWLVLPYYAGEPLAEGPHVPAEVWTALARVHAHWLGKRPRGLLVIDAAWWRSLCRDRIRPAVVGAGERTGDRRCGEVAEALWAWADDPRIRLALGMVPRTLVHGDAHRGNILVDSEGAVLVDWGNARVAPAGVDLAVLRAQGAGDPATYQALFAELTGGPQRPDLAEVERWLSDVLAHVGYLGFAADHLGVARVAELAGTAEQALSQLGPAVADLRR
ncbi:phosphotransferase [Pseudonocardia hispaniensis]|uniref:Phosphotransferase n=1 Tax=Pseudonocardia hispaniensis TaxID=904933 RepID=A0ABW1J7P0_9PSEU